MRKITFLFLFLMTATLYVCGQSVVINESKGWFESASVKWSPLGDGVAYNVYCKNANSADSEYQKLDNMLIRKYAGYLRADAVGLKEGNYKLKVVPVINEVEDASKGAVTDAIVVQKHIREGFAFLPSSPLKTGSGAYNEDGTLGSNAKVLYLTATTANTVELDVIVDAKGKVETITGLTNILSAKQKGYDKTPLAIRVIGEVKDTNIAGLNSNGYIEIKGKGAFTELNVTLEGVGDDATLNGWAILVRNAGNIEIRNVGVMNFKDDGISLDTDNTNIWIHNVDFFYGKQGSGDKAKGDGSMDVKTNSKYVTISYNHFWDSGKSSLCGMTSESGPNYITYHHNWFDHSDSRHPRVRTMSVHVYNNYFDGNAKYGVGATTGSSVFVENNYFRNCKNPMLISKQGTDIFSDSKGTFSGETGGIIKAFGNEIVGANRFVDQNAYPTGFDAVVVASRNETVSETYKTLLGGNTYNNFDTNSSLMYSYTPHLASEVVSVVAQYAGRIDGGDLKWTFDNAVDDISYDINVGLRSAVDNYKGTVLAIGSDSSTEPIDPVDPTDPPVDPIDPVEPSGSVIHDFTANGMTSGFFTITGSLSTTKGSVEYAGQTLTQCLKIETPTKITFTTTKSSTLILVFNADFNKKIKIDGESYSVVAGILELTLPAGAHEITKGDTSNLFYMSVKYANDAVGIENIEEIKLILYPNPVVDKLTIASDAEVKSIDVYSLTGALVLQLKGNNRSVDMSGLNKGSYIVNVSTVASTFKQIVIKK